MLRILPARELVKQRLNYDEATGIFTWRKRPLSSFATIGACNTWNTRFANTIAGEQGVKYTQIAINGKKYLAHRLAWLYVHGEPVPNEIDHCDRNKLNNAISNLRCATRSQNNINTELRSDNVSGFKGIRYDSKYNCYRVEIWHNRIKHYLGTFYSLDQAIEVRERIAKKIYGDYAT